MAQLPPKRPGPEDEDDQRLGAEAYEATVPTQLGGFRGTNPLAFVVGGAIAFAIILVAFLAFIHRGNTPPRVVASTTAANQVPVGAGIGAAPQQTPFIPEATFAPLPPVTAPPIFRIPLTRPLGESRVASAEPPSTPPPGLPFSALPSSGQQPAYDRHDYRPTVPAPQTNVVASSGEMTIAQPSAAPQASGQQQQPQPAQASTKYVPVYRGGRLVAVVPVEQPAQAAATATAPPAAAPANAAAASGDGGGADAGGQFMSNQNAAPSDPSALGAANSGLLEARKFSRITPNEKIGYSRTQSKRQLDSATVINARLLTKIESDLPGVVIGQVSEPVYDSATHTVVVVPAGSKVFGEYDEETVASSRRLILGFSRIIFPDGQEFDIARQLGTSADGAAGFAGDLDQHRGQLYTSALLLTVLAGAESALSPQSGAGVLTGQSISGQIQSAAGAELAQTANKIVDQAINRPATVIIRPPYTFQIIVRQDLPLDAYEAQHP